jgi:hypothetical protein
MQLPAFKIPGATHMPIILTKRLVELHTGPNTFGKLGGAHEADSARGHRIAHQASLAHGKLMTGISTECRLIV